MSRLLLAAVALVGIGCVTTPPAETEPSPAVEVPAAEPAASEAEAATESTDALASCIATCEQASMARSVAWEIVQADCLASCTGEEQPLEESLTPDAGP